METRPPLDPASPYQRIPLRPHELVSPVTPTEELFVLAHLGVPRVAPATWRLEVGGLVRTPRVLTLDALRALPKRELEAFHQCVGSPFALDAPTRRIANVVWGGVDLRALLDEVGVDPGARFVWSHGLDHGEFAGIEADAYVKDLPLSALEHHDVLLAYELNGQPLPPEHGFPVRLVVPGFYGTNSVKWLWRIELADRRAPGPFTTRLYNDRVGDASTPVWRVAPESVIVSPAPEARIDRTPAEIRGWAWAAAGVAAVEVSTDGGASWSRTELEPRRQWSWQPFRLEWTPSDDGRATLLSRATDADGESQPGTGARNAVHAVPVTVALRPGGAVTRS